VLHLDLAMFLSLLPSGKATTFKLFWKRGNDARQYRSGNYDRGNNLDLERGVKRSEDSVFLFLRAFCVMLNLFDGGRNVVDIGAGQEVDHSTPSSAKFCNGGTIPQCLLLLHSTVDINYGDLPCTDDSVVV
jgi:hypothetical protein